MSIWRRLGTPGRVAVFVAGTLLVLLVLAQALLPGIAAERIRSKVARYGTVRSVHVSAWPALELLWGQADSVEVQAGSLAIEPQQAAALLWEVRHVARMDLHAAAVDVGGLELTGATLHQRGSALMAEANATQAAAQAALPPGLEVAFLRSGAGSVEVRASGGLFGIDASLNAVAQASEGKLVAHPVGAPFEALRLTLFSDPHVYVEGVGASVASQGPLSYRLQMRASLR